MGNHILDVPVLLIFFNRPQTFRQVFASVRQAKPKKILLWQDGPRVNRPDDMTNIMECRKIAESIDWKCEVFHNYHDKNFGCDPSTYFAHKWAFSLVERCIILEDDQVPDQSFYPYCQELLERYANDNRISHICGYNSLGESTWCPNDYLFAYTGTGAWASWRRVAENWDSAYRFLDDQYNMANLAAHYGKRSRYWINYSIRHRNSGIAHWESILGMALHLNSQYAIIPKKNLVCNVGVTADATHCNVANIALLPRSARAFFLPSRSLQFPLKHPNAILPDGQYTREAAKLALPCFWKKILNYAEMIFLAVKYGELRQLMLRILKHLK